MDIRAVLVESSKKLIYRLPRAPTCCPCLWRSWHAKDLKSGRHAGLPIETPAPAKITSRPSRKAAFRGFGNRILCIVPLPTKLHMRRLLPIVSRYEYPVEECQALCCSSYPCNTINLRSLVRPSPLRVVSPPVPATTLAPPSHRPRFRDEPESSSCEGLSSLSWRCSGALVQCVGDPCMSTASISERHAW